MTFYVRIKIVGLSLMLLLVGITTSHGEAFLCKNEAAIRATAYVESPLGMLSLNENNLLSTQPSENLVAGQNTTGEFQYLLYPGKSGVMVTVDIDGVRTALYNLNDCTCSLPFIHPVENSNIKLIEAGCLFDRVSAETRTVTISVIYSEN